MRSYICLLCRPENDAKKVLVLVNSKEMLLNVLDVYNKITFMHIKATQKYQVLLIFAASRKLTFFTVTD
jgi:hypothetical protein